MTETFQENLAALPPHVMREISWPDMLKQGDKGPEVKRVQEWLNYHGYKTAIDGDYGPATRELVRRFSVGRFQNSPPGVAGHGLLVELSAPLWGAFAWSPSISKPETLRGCVLSVAHEHLARRPREFGGDNRGPWVRAYCRGHDGPEYKWCAGSALSILEQAAKIAGVPMPLEFTLGCDELARDAKAKGRLTHDPGRARPGDLFLCRKGSDYYHVGILTAMRPTIMETLEGNTNEDGSANGYEFTDRTRNLVNKDYVLLHA